MIGRAAEIQFEAAGGAAAAQRAAHLPHVLFLGNSFAGHRTRFLNLQANTERDARIRSSYHCVTGWVDGGAIERLPILPANIKNRLRMVAQGAPVASIPRPDVIWYSAGNAALPYLWSQAGRLKRPLVIEGDCTVELLEGLAPAYFNRAPRRGLQLRMAEFWERAIWRTAALFTPWSQWVANSLQRRGIPDDRIVVLPPGVDLNHWRPRTITRGDGEEPLRLLFVGGDFGRKGGPLLVDVLRRRFAGRCELDIVTRDEVPSAAGIRVHRAEPNSPVLRDLYAQADLFVLPTQAECFGLATIEAMASGLPVLVGDVGGAREIVDVDETGWLIESTPAALEMMLERALANRGRLRRMGDQARKIAEVRFDGKANDNRLVGLLVELAQRGRSLPARDAWGSALPGDDSIPQQADLR